MKTLLTNAPLLAFQQILPAGDDASGSGFRSSAGSEVKGWVSSHLQVELSRSMRGTMGSQSWKLWALCGP